MNRKTLAIMSLAAAALSAFGAPDGERAIECVAHRGYWNAEIPENTVEAIRRAYVCGANWVETDFNLERDGRMLCYHDLKRRDAVVKPPFHVPTVDEVLAVVPKNRGIQCEIKTYGPAYADVFDRAVKAAGLSETNVIVSSFNAAALKDFKRQKPAYRTLFLSGVNEKTTPDELIAEGRDMGVFAICPSAEQAKKRGWTVEQADKIRAAGFSYRFFGVNRPGVLKYAAEVGAEAFTCNFFEDAFAWAKAAGVTLVPPAKRSMMTKWGETITPENAWREYPRPQMVRDNWVNLNGEWDYAITSVTNTPGRPEKWDGKILVPFALESALSGVGKTLEPDQFLWYTRKIKVEKRGGERILLHFGAVDFRTMVFIGHQEVTDVPHEGGQNPFTLDITDYVEDGENELTVCVWDPTEDFVNSRGKQSFNPRGCFYTRVSGIWQTVWMETVPAKRIESYQVVPDIDKGTVAFKFTLVGGYDDSVVVKVFDADGKKVAGDDDDANKRITVEMPEDFRLWSPESPYLYAFTATCGKDEIGGYFGMRKFEKRKDANGVLRFFLNNKPYYVMATLDQGWWPDGLLTPPSEEAMAFDIQTLKDCGFNTMRKHIKVEPLRYYHLCDKMGLLVIQDLPSGNASSSSPLDPRATARYWLERQEQKEMMDLLQAVPSIVMWNPYNEGWTQPGEFLTHSMLDFVRRYDPTRLVNGPSGCWDWEGGHLLPRGWAWTNRVETAHKPAGVCEAADTVDLHLYRGPKMLKVNDRRISFLGEFGGLGHPVEGHLWKEAKGGWGYGGIADTKTREGLEKTYLGLMDKLGDLAEWGCAGSVYTQTTDVEIEINGLLTYDRKVLKYNPEVLKKAHREVIRRATNPKRNELLYISHVHRGGGKKESPDNTLETFKWCWENGSALECDCRKTKDGVGVMLHDDKLKRTACGVSDELANKSVSNELAWDVIKDVDVGSYLGPQFAHHRIPTIEETFAAMKGHPTYLCFVDEKGAGPEYIAKKAVEAGVQDQVYYTGPSHEKIFEWQKILPGGKAMIWLGAWPKDHGSEERARTDRWFRDAMAKLRTKEFKFIDIVSIHTYYDPKDPTDPFVPSTPLLTEMINEFHANGIKVASIPFQGGETEEVYFKLHELGVDGFSTDYPSVMFKVIKDLKAR